MRLKFRNPPIDELVLGTYFPPIEKLQSQHVGRFWGASLADFPVCTQHPPIRTVVHNEGEPFPMPRFWLVSGDDATLIQIQKDAFIANWRNRRGGGAYPHYEAVRRLFDTQFGKFSAFLLETIGYHLNDVVSAELVYINFLPGYSLSNLADALPPMGAIAIPANLTSGEVSLNANLQYDVDNDLSIQLNVASATRSADKVKGVRLEIRAQGVPTPANWTGVGGWFDKAHDAVGGAFLGLTSETLQRSWGPVEGGL